MWTFLGALLAQLRAQLGVLRRSEAGYSTETVVVTALLVLLAIAVLGALAAAVTAKVKGIDLGGTPQP